MLLVVDEASNACSSLGSALCKAAIDAVTESPSTVFIMLASELFAVTPAPAEAPVFPASVLASSVVVASVGAGSAASALF